jgi:hypothetical protein
MATCRECLFYEKCVTRMMSKQNMFGGLDDLEHDCPSFKSKSDYVKRERGEWIKQGKDWDCKCSICGGESFYHLDSTPSNFCPKCGADMRKEDNNV